MHQCLLIGIHVLFPCLSCALRFQLLQKRAQQTA
jgi:hypothetical protein